METQCIFVFALFFCFWLFCRVAPYLVTMYLRCKKMLRACQEAESN